MAKIYNTSKAFTQKATNIIDTYSTINDRISVIYAKEFAGGEYKNLSFANENLTKLMNFEDNDELYILCCIEDSQENLSYILHKFKLINDNYCHTSSKILNYSL